MSWQFPQVGCPFERGFALLCVWGCHKAGLEFRADVYKVPIWLFFVFVQI